MTRWSRWVIQSTIGSFVLQNDWQPVWVTAVSALRTGSVWRSLLSQAACTARSPAFYFGCFSVLPPRNDVYGFRFQPRKPVIAVWVLYERGLWCALISKRNNNTVSAARPNQTLLSFPEKQSRGFKQLKHQDLVQSPSFVCLFLQCLPSHSGFGVGVANCLTSMHTPTQGVLRGTWICISGINGSTSCALVGSLVLSAFNKSPLNSTENQGVLPPFSLSLPPSLACFLFLLWFLLHRPLRWQIESSHQGSEL